MCGIAGFIGKSQNPRVSYELANSLLVKTEKRGEHATGFWACERGDGKIFWDKEPTKSSVYVTRDIWCKHFAAADADLLISHCRYTSLNVGHEKYNKNNHPHVSEDRRVALVHNGKIPEYGALKGRYDLRSDCDSEILLGMFESGIEYKNKEDYLKQEFPTLSPEVAYRMMGLREVFSRVNYGAMAVAIGERGEDTKQRYLWLFRDDERPLHVIDMRKTLGQIFFCSEAEIWRSAVEACPSVKHYIPNDQVIIEFPAYQVWMLSVEPNDKAKAENLAWEAMKDQKDKDDVPLYPNREAVTAETMASAALSFSDTWKIKKFRITKTKFYDWKSEDDDDKLKRVKASKPVAKVVTRLAADEEVVQPKEKDNTPVKTECHVAAPPGKKKANHSLTVVSEEVRDVKAPVEKTETEESEINMQAFDTLVGELRQLLSDVDTNVKNLEKEGTLTGKDFSLIMDSLKDAHSELKASLVFIK